jgi:hypothetical protein
MTLDDKEINRARIILDEMSGDESFIVWVVWQQRTSPEARLMLAERRDTYG